MFLNPSYSLTWEKGDQGNNHPIILEMFVLSISPHLLIWVYLKSDFPSVVLEMVTYDSGKF